MLRTSLHALVIGAFLASSAVSSTAVAGIVQNGSLEDPQSNFVGFGATGYMQLPNGSTKITGWTVSTTANNIAWASPANTDLIAAADGGFWVDLTGFGAESTDGALSQTLTVIAGSTYQFAIDTNRQNDGTVLVTVGSQTITLSPGAISNGWQEQTGSFVALSSETTPLLSIMNNSPGAQKVFIDDIIITGDVAVPEPGSLALLGLGLAGLGFGRRRKLKAA